MHKEKKAASGRRLAATGTERLTNLGNLSHYSTSVLSLSSQDPADLVDTAPERTHCYTCESKKVWRRPSDGEPLCSVCHPPPPGFAGDVITIDEQGSEPGFWSTYDQADQERQEEESERLKDERRAMCGQWRHGHLSPMDGRWKWFQFRCRQWRGGLCPACLTSRAKSFQARIYHAMEDGEIVMLTLAKDDAGKLARRLDKSQYLRLPTTDGDVMFVDGDVNGELVDKDTMKTLDWSTLAMTPEGRNTSGDLGKKEPEPDVEKVTVKSIVIHSDTTKEQLAEALEKAVEATANVRPKTLEEVQAALDARMDAFIDALKNAGGSILAYRCIKVKCQISAISWVAYSRNLQQEDLKTDDDVPF